MGKRVSYPALDRMKYAGAIMVIMIHCDTLIPQAETNFFIKNIICRIAVPFFFVSSSFFIRKGMQMRPEYLKEYFLHLINSYVVWSILFLPMGLDWIHQNQEVPIELLPAALFVGFVHIGTYYHLWYIPAFILSVIFIVNLLKRFSYQKVFVISLVLYLFGSLETYYGLLPSGWFKDFFDLVIRLTFTTRNGLFFGMIFTLIGFFIYDHQEKLSRMGKHSSSFLLLFGSLFVLEGLFLFHIHRLDMNFILMLVPLSFFLFLWLLSKNPTQNSCLKKLRELSQYYYFIHPICIVLVEETGKALKLSMLSSGILSFLTILFLTHVFAKVIIHIRSKPLRPALLLKTLFASIGLTLILAGSLYQFKVSSAVIKFEFVPCIWVISSFFSLFFFMNWRMVLPAVKN